jgi:hypothetical protein
MTDSNKIIQPRHKRGDIDVFQDFDVDNPNSSNTVKPTKTVKKDKDVVPKKELNDEPERTSVYMRPSYMNQIKDFQYEKWNNERVKLSQREIIELALDLLKNKNNESA